MEILPQKLTVNFKNKAMKNFRNSIIILSTLFLLITTISYAQVTTTHPTQSQPNGQNIISCSAYESITYNGHTIDQINATNGDTSSIQSLLGSYTSATNNDNSWERLFMFGSNRLAFDTEFERLTIIEIIDSQWPVKILGKEIRVGDHFNELKQKFGNDLKIIYKPEINPNYVVSFNCLENDYDGTLIDINVTTNTVEEIIYFINP